MPFGLVVITGVARWYATVSLTSAWPLTVTSVEPSACTEVDVET